MARTVLENVKSRRVIRRYYLFRITNTSGFFLPVAIILLRLVAGWGTELLGAVDFLPWAGVSLALAAGVLWVLVSPVRRPRATTRGRAQSATATD